MSALGVRRTIRSLWGQKPARSMWRLLQVRVFFHLLRIAISLLLLPLDNAIFLAVVVIGKFSTFFARSSPLRRRRAALQDVQFYPKTVLVTGVDTPQGLAVARAWYHEGHRVVGSGITDNQLSSGESMSKALSAFYRIPRPQYVSRLLDIIQREKVDVWIPCSQGASVMDDAVAKQAIERKTPCQCITMDTAFANQFSRPESFVQYLISHDLPVVERHQVQSRDSIHKILHASPTKIYHIRKTTPSKSDNKPVILPKRTLSLTYSEVSEIQISKDSPWSMQQFARMGEFLAELLVIRGHVSALKIRPAHRKPQWGHSPMIGGLATAIHNLMDQFALKAGPKMTGHLCLRLMVDEELDTNSVRYVVHIAGCVPGAAATKHLLQSSLSQSLVEGYLEILSPQNSALSRNLTGGSHPHSRGILSQLPSQRPGLYQIVKGYDPSKLLLTLYPIAQRIDYVVHEAADLACFWKNWRFSLTDPLPWWWNTHVYLPLREIDLMIHSKSRRAA